MCSTPGRAGAGQLMRQEGDARRRNHRLGRVDRERSQPCSLATDQEDRFCHLVVSASCSGPACSPVSVSPCGMTGQFRQMVVPAR